MKGTMKANWATVIGYRISREQRQEQVHAEIAAATKEWLAGRGLERVPMEKPASLLAGDLQAQEGLLGPIQAKRKRRARMQSNTHPE